MAELRNSERTSYKATHVQVSPATGTSGKRICPSGGNLVVRADAFTIAQLSELAAAAGLTIQNAS